ncbi:hypothetical protein Barb6XT_00014 [Bacteroidales bacterium Barb6XT]|nr:hypothetical protein Barb6XT_00014 [Bacteroidales bacterium Barb6XT]
MKRRFNFLLTALLLFAATGHVWATKAVYKAVPSGAFSANSTTAPADVTYYVVTETDITGLSASGSFSGVADVITALGATPSYEIYHWTNAGTVLKLLAVHNATDVISDIPKAITFDAAKNITTVDLTGSPAKKIGDNAFTSVTGLTTVDLTDVTAIGANAFNGIAALTSVTWGSTVKTIGANAFKGTGLTSTLSLPASITLIDAGAFAGLTGLTTVTLTNATTLATIGEGAFAGSGTNAAAVALPASSTVTLTIGKDAFKGFGTATPTSGGISFAAAANSGKVIIKEGAFDGAWVGGTTIDANAKIDFANSAAGFARADIQGAPDLQESPVGGDIKTAFAGAKFSGTPVLPVVIPAGAFAGAEFTADPGFSNVTKIGANAFDGAKFTAAPTAITLVGTNFTAVGNLGANAFKDYTGTLTIGGGSKAKDFLTVAFLKTVAPKATIAYSAVASPYDPAINPTVTSAPYSGAAHVPVFKKIGTETPVAAEWTGAIGGTPTDLINADEYTADLKIDGVDIHSSAAYAITRVNLADVTWADAVVSASDTSASDLQAALKKLIIGKLGSYTLVQGTGEDYTVGFSSPLTAIKNSITEELEFHATITPEAVSPTNFKGTKTVYIAVREESIKIDGSAVVWDETPFVLEEDADNTAKLKDLIKGYYGGTEFKSYTVTFSDVEDGRVIATIKATGSKFTGTKIITIEVRSSAVHLGGGAVVWTENASIEAKTPATDYYTKNIPADLDKVDKAFKGVYGTIELISGTDYKIDTFVYANDRQSLIVTVKALGKKYTGSKEIVITIFAKEERNPDEVLKPGDTNKNTVLKLTGNKLPKGLADLDEVYEIELSTSIDTIKTGSFPNAARIGKGIDISGLTGADRKLVIEKDAFAGQTLIVEPGQVLKLDNVGAGAFEGAKFVTDSGAAAAKPIIQFTSKVKELPAGILANASGVILDLSGNNTLLKADATTLAGFNPRDIKGLFSTNVNDKDVPGLFNVKLSNTKPLKAGDNNTAIQEDDANGVEVLKLVSIYSNNRQEVHFDIFNNALGGRLEDKKDYDVTVESSNHEVADLNSLIDADTYTLGLRFKGYEGFDEALADGRITFKIEKYPLNGGTVGEADSRITVKSVQFVAGNVPFLYTGKSIKPVPDEEFTVKDNFNSTLVFGKDYELTTGDDGKVNAYDLSVNAGNKKIKIKAVEGGNYTGSFELPYSVGQRPLSDLDIRVVNRYFNTKTGAAVTIVPDNISATLNGEPVILVNRTDYKFTGSGSTGDGISFKGLGDHPITLEARTGLPDLNFRGDYKTSVTLVENNIHSAVVSTIATKNYTYTGKPIDVVTSGSLKLRDDLEEGVDYEVVYTPDKWSDVRNGITVYVQGIGIWGEKDPVGTFNIVAEKFEKLSVNVDDYTLKYAEDPNDALASIKETVTVSLNGTELPLDDFDIKTGLSTKRDKVTVEVTLAAGNKNFTAGTATKTVNINPYTGNEAVTASAASVSYANGILTLTNLDGAIATIVSLNGRIAARFAVSGSEVQKAVALAPGFYILSAGKTVSKFIVR